MAITHAEPGQVVDILGEKDAAGEGTATLFKSQQLQVIRMEVLEGKELPAHRVAGPLTLQCLEGRVAVTARGRTQELRSGQMLYLLGDDEHGLKGIERSTLLLTIVLT